jgi:hypothetical protein
VSDWPGPPSPAEPPRQGRSTIDVVLVVVAVATGLIALLIPSPQERRLIVGALLAVCVVCVLMLVLNHRERRKAAAASQDEADPTDAPDDPPDPDGREPWS